MMKRTTRHIAGLMLGLAVILTGCTLPNSPIGGADTVTYEGPPVVSLAAPQPNSTYLLGTPVNILARIENAGPEMGRIEVRVNDTIIGNQDVSAQAGAPAFSVSQSWPTTETGQFTIGVTAFRPDGTSSTPATVTINVMDELGGDDTGSTNGGTVQTPTSSTGDTNTIGSVINDQPAAPADPTDTPEPTDPPEPTDVPPTATPDTPRVRVTTGANIRRGPSQAFNPPIGSLAVNAEADLLGVSPDGQWYKIQYFNSEGWIFATLVETTGDTSNLPVDAGPPTPIPATATPIPTETPRPAQVDLSIVDSSTDPFPLVCNDSSRIEVTVVNSGSDRSPSTIVVVEDLFNGQVIERTEAPVKELNSNENTTLVLNLTVSTNFDEGHTHRIRVDPNNSVPESNEGNNTEEYDYVLQEGDC